MPLSQPIAANFSLKGKAAIAIRWPLSSIAEVIGKFTI